MLLRILGHNLRVVLGFVQLADDLFPLFVAGAAELSDVPGKGLRQHVLLQAGELLENRAVKELFCQGKSLDILDSDVVELAGLRREHVVVTDVAIGGALLGDQVSSLLHVVWPQDFILEVFVEQILGLFVYLPVAVEADRPLSLQYEVDLCHIKFLLIQIAVLSRVLKHARHEPEPDFIQKVSIKLFAHLEEGLERGGLDDVLEQELAHDVLLNFERDAVEVGLPGHEHRASVVFPEVPEVVLNPVAQGYGNVHRALIRLILDLLDQQKPFLQLIFIVVEVLVAHPLNHIDETVHEDGEEGHSEDLDHCSNNLFRNRDRTEIAIPDRAQRCQGVVHDCC